MAENKTKQTEQDPREFLNQIEHERKREDAFVIMELMQEITGEEPKMWGTSIIGFGSQHYKYESGREGDMPHTGFSPRKQSLTLYLTTGFDNYDALLGELGKHKTSKACLYINKLADVNMDVLRELVKQSVDHVAKTDPTCN